MTQGSNPYPPQPPPAAPAQPYNPYAPPSAQAQTGAPNPMAAGVGPNMWLDGESVVVPREGSSFPDRCIQCNAPSTGEKLRRRLYWHPVWVYFLILLNLWIYIIVALIMRKKAQVHVGLCDTHRAKRKSAFLIGWIGAIASMATCTGGIAADSDVAGPVLALAGGLGFLVFLIVGIVRARVVSATKMDDTHAWLKVGKPFADSLRS